MFLQIYYILKYIVKKLYFQQTMSDKSLLLNTEEHILLLNYKKTYNLCYHESLCLQGEEYTFKNIISHRALL